MRTSFGWKGNDMVHSIRGSTRGSADKTVKSIDNTCHTRALLQWGSFTKGRYIHIYILYLFLHFYRMLWNMLTSLLTDFVAGLPLELYTVWEAYPWQFGQPYCLLKTFLTELSSTASVLIITAFTVERYVAICHPLKAHTLSSLPRVTKTIICLWFVAILACIPYPMHTRTSFSALTLLVGSSDLLNQTMIWPIMCRV